MHKTKIALLLGGTSKEREVSLNTGEQIKDALDRNKYEVFVYDTKNDLKRLIEDIFDNQIDLVFPALHGEYGEDGRLQGLLESLNVNFLFSGCESSAVCMNKYFTKNIVSKHGLNIVKDIVVKKNQEFNISDIDEFNFPVILKPNNSGSSIGIEVIQKKEEVENALNRIFTNEDEIIIEEYISGREFTVGVMGNNNLNCLPVVEIKPKYSDWFDFKSKYEEGATEEVCPAKISTGLEQEIKNSALSAYKALNCKDLARADFIVSENDNKVYFIEINTIPGMTKTSLIPLSAKKSGINFSSLLDELIEGALRNK